MRFLVALFTLLTANVAMPADMAERPGWAVHPTSLSYSELSERMAPAIKAEGMGLVTRAGPTGAAKARGIVIPGNRVYGIFNNKFAVRTLETSTAAMIEAPVRMYVTENADGTATLSYKTPSLVFAPYFDEGGTELRAIAAELDDIFARIAERAITP